MKVFLSLFIVLVFVSCGKDYDCPPGGLALKITKYNNTNNDSIIIESYVKNDNYNSLIKSDTIFLNDTIHQYMMTHYDSSVVFYTQYSEYGDGIFTIENDWLIKTKNYNYIITDLSYKLETRHCGGIFSLDCDPCFSPIISYKLDGDKISTIEYNTIHLEN